MLWFLPENGDPIGGRETHEEKGLRLALLQIQALSEGCCPNCYINGAVVKIVPRLVGVGWSNQRVRYVCPECSANS